jgi:hypothetical protein
MSTATAIKPEVTRLLQGRKSAADEIRALIDRKTSALCATSAPSSGEMIWHLIRSNRPRGKVIANLAMQLAAIEGKPAPDSAETEAQAFRKCLEVQWGGHKSPAYRRLSTLLTEHLDGVRVELEKAVDQWRELLQGEFLPDPRDNQKNVVESFQTIGAERVTLLADVERRLKILGTVNGELAKIRAKATTDAIAACGGAKGLEITVVEATAAIAPPEFDVKLLRSELTAVEIELAETFEGGRLHGNLTVTRENLLKSIRERVTKSNERRRAAATSLVEEFKRGADVAVARVSELHSQMPAAFPSDFGDHLVECHRVPPDQALKLITCAFDPS